MRRRPPIRTHPHYDADPPPAPDLPYDRFSLGPFRDGISGRELIGHVGPTEFNVGRVTSAQAGIQLTRLFDSQMKRFPRKG